MKRAGAYVSCKLDCHIRVRELFIEKKSSKREVPILFHLGNLQDERHTRGQATEKEGGWGSCSRAIERSTEVLLCNCLDFLWKQGSPARSPQIIIPTTQVSVLKWNEAGGILHMLEKRIQRKLGFRA